MAYSQLITDIEAAIYANGNEEITGTVLQTVLVSMVNELGAEYQYAGVATPSTSVSATADKAVFYLAVEHGTYSNMGGSTLSDGIGIFAWNGTSWAYANLPSATFVSTDATPTNGSTKPVQSGGVYNALQQLGQTIVWDAGTTANPSLSGHTWAELVALVAANRMLIVKATADGNEYWHTITATASESDTLTQVILSDLFNADNSRLLLTENSGAIAITATSVTMLTSANYTSYTYTKEQVNALVDSINQFEYVVADTLPTASADTMYKIYLIPNPQAQNEDIKDEYITIATTSGGTTTYDWEHIGTTQIDLSNYYTKNETDTLLTSKQNLLQWTLTPTIGATDAVVSSDAVARALQGKQNALTFDNTPTQGSINPVRSHGIYMALQNVQNVVIWDGVDFKEWSELQSIITDSTKYFILKYDGVYYTLATKTPSIKMLGYGSGAHDIRTATLTQNGTLINVTVTQITTESVTQNGTGLVTSGGVYTALQGKIDKAQEFENGGIPSYDENGNLEYSGINAQDISDIVNEIPSDTTAQNPLVNQSGMVSAINTAAATFKGVHTSYNNLRHNVLDATANDYAIVSSTDANGNFVYTVYQFDHNNEQGTLSYWNSLYSFYNNGFSTAQWAAINSGITSALVSKLSGLPSQVMSEQAINNTIAASTRYLGEEIIISSWVQEYANIYTSAMITGGTGKKFIPVWLDGETQAKIREYNDAETEYTETSITNGGVYTLTTNKFKVVVSSEGYIVRYILCNEATNADKINTLIKADNKYLGEESVIYCGNSIGAGQYQSDAVTIEDGKTIIITWPNSDYLANTSINNTSVSIAWNTPYTLNTGGATAQVKFTVGGYKMMCHYKVVDVAMTTTDAAKRIKDVEDTIGDIATILASVV